MSYDIYLQDAETGETIEFDQPHTLRGGTYAVGGTTEAWLNVTYNYGGHFARVLGKGGIRSIYGTTGEASIPVLKAAADKLGDDVSEDYWASTEGNAKRALLQLMQLAELCPEGVWAGD